jgi:3-oxoacyl-[acyl-carrier protein] reductase
MSEQRVAIVTGASRGIGRAIAEGLAADGMFVVVNYTANEAAAAEVLAAIEKAGGKGSLSRFDVSDPAAVDTAVRAVADERGRLDVVVSNAGIAIDALLLRAKKEDWARTLDVNLSGAFHLFKAASRHLLRSDSGRIITISSLIGEMGNTGQVAYAAAKAGLIGMTKSLAREFASRGVTSNCVTPGWIETDMTAGLIAGDARDAVVKQIPLGRIGTAADIASAVRFLASPGASYITGQVIRVNGGLLM